MPPDFESFLFLILPQIVSPVSTRRKKSGIKKFQKIGVPVRKPIDTPMLQAISIATEINYIARCLMLR